MDHNTAQNAQKLNAFVKVRPHDAFQHWSHGRITEFHGGNKAVVKCGSVLRKVYIEDIELDKSRNLSEGIIVEKSDEPNTAGDPWIILNLREWEGYTGSGWSQDENRWKHYDTIRHADAERDRLKNNNITGVKSIRLSQGIEMRDSALESATSCENCEPPTSLDSLSRIPGITRDIRAYAKASQEFARIAQDQCAAESERETDKDLRQKLENEISEHQRRIKAIEHREREREEIMEQRSLEMGGLLAKLKAMLPA